MSLAYRYPAQSLTQLPRPGRNPRYRAWVRKNPCIVTGVTWNIEFAHTGPRGLGQKANDLDGIPLNREVHREYHEWGRVRFESVYQIDITLEIQRLQSRAIACGIKLECEPRLKRKGFGRASVRKRLADGGAVA